MSGVAANSLTVNQIKQQPSAKSDTRLLFYSADLQHVVRHGSHGIFFPHPHSHLPTVALPNATFGYSKSSELPQSRHGAATERPQSHHRAAMDPTASSHLIHISPQSLYLMPPSATQSHQSCHKAATEPPRSGHRATTELPWIPRHHPISSTSPHSRST